MDTTDNGLKHEARSDVLLDLLLDLNVIVNIRKSFIQANSQNSRASENHDGRRSRAASDAEQ